MQLQARKPEAHDERDEDQRDAAEEIRVDDRQGAERCSSAPWQAAHDRDREREDQHERLGREHQLQIHLEPGPDVRQREPGRAGAEEDLQDLVERVHAVPTSAPESRRSSG